tara:strand:+ start:2564 stop:2908 length:345 start_codon:yes stop_codon:yes gene_type:complete
MEYKIDEITEHAKDNLLDCCNYNADYITQDESEIHHDLFNTDYYIIGTYKAKKWLGNQAFDIIGFIKDYEMDNFGEVYTDLSDAERVVNMYVYIIGEQILSDTIKDVKNILKDK